MVTWRMKLVSIGRVDEPSISHMCSNSSGECAEKVERSSASSCRVSLIIAQVPIHYQSRARVCLDVDKVYASQAWAVININSVQRKAFGYCLLFGVSFPALAMHTAHISPQTSLKLSTALDR